MEDQASGIAKEGRKPQPHTAALRGVASHGPWFGMHCQSDRIGKALAPCHEHYVLRQIPAAVAYLLRTVRGGHHSPVAMPFPRSPRILTILQPNSSPLWPTRQLPTLPGLAQLHHQFTQQMEALRSHATPRSHRAELGENSGLLTPLPVFCSLGKSHRLLSKLTANC